MRITRLLACCTLLLSCAALPAMAQNLPDLDGGDPGQTPYQKLETIFRGAGKMQLQQIPLQTARPRWSACALAGPETKREDVVNVWGVPVRVRGIVVDSPVIPPRGPLFPGSPERSHPVEYISFHPDPPSGPIPREVELEAGRDFVSQGIRIVTSPDLEQTSRIDGINGKLTGRLRTVFRITPAGFLVARQEIRGGDNGDEDQYYYCFRH